MGIFGLTVSCVVAPPAYSPSDGSRRANRRRVGRGFLPTGKYGSQNVLTGVTVGRSLAFFSSGPNSTGGQALDTSMQHGTGSTDVIVGAYYYQPVSRNFDAFVNGQFQSAAVENLHSLG